MEARNENALYCSLHRRVLLLQRRMRALRSQAKFPLDSVSAIILVWIGYKPSLQFGDLQRHLKIPKASLSRLLKNLVSHGFLTSRTSEVDSRKKTFAFTQKGFALWGQLETINNRLVRIGAYPLDASQIRAATEAIRAIASGLGAPLEPERPGEEPLFTQIRRLSRVSCMVGPNYLGVDHDIMIYHIFSELGFSGRPVPLQFFIKNLRIPPSSLSREVSKLAQRGLVLKEQARHDRKLTLLKLTEKGWRHFWACEELIGMRYKAALATVPASTIQQWIEAFEPLAGLESPTFKEAPLFAERCTSEESLRPVRAFIVEEAVRTGRHQNLPNTILPPGRVCISVREADQILAVALAPAEQHGPQAIFSSFFLSREVSTPQLEKEVFAKAAECLRGCPMPYKIEGDDPLRIEVCAPSGTPEQASSPFPSSAPNPLSPLPSAT